MPIPNSPAYRATRSSISKWLFLLSLNGVSDLPHQKCDPCSRGNQAFELQLWRFNAFRAQSVACLDSLLTFSVSVVDQSLGGSLRHVEFSLHHGFEIYKSLRRIFGMKSYLESVSEYEVATIRCSFSLPGL
jgi:hypothetical protein